ncbi:MAG: mechanosensitive ion channel [Bacteroidetes bacterium]|nr:mechanosensitive ion channel [Bacteroidota bacterium]
MNFEKGLKLALDKISSWTSSLIAMLPNLLVASVILVVGLYLAKRIRKFADKKLRKFFPTVTLANLTISLIYIFFVGVVIFIVLKVLNLDSTLSTALGFAGILSVGLAFAFQDIAANFISGIFLSFSKPFKVGELIAVNKYEGFVEGVKLRDTTLRTHQGYLVTVPNKQIFQSPLINYTRYGKRRADITSGVSQGDDLKKVRAVATEALQKVPNVIAEDTTFYFEGLGESTIDFKIRIWVNSDQYADYLRFINDVIIILKEAFDANDISLPFPIRTLDFNMKGGEKLSDMKLQIVNKNSEATQN